MKTAELMRKNQQLNRDLAALRRDADAFVRSVLSNPENAGLVALTPEQMRLRQQQMLQQQQQHQKGPFSGGGKAQNLSSTQPVFVNGNLDFHVPDGMGGVRRLPTAIVGGGGGAKRKVEVVSEPMAFEDVSEVTSLNPKRARLSIQQ